MQPGAPGARATCGVDQCHLVVVGVDRPQGAQTQRLRFDGDDPGAEATEAADVVAHVRADVEDEIPALTKRE